MRRKGARCQIPFEADRSRALPVDAQLSTVIAPSLVRPRARRGTLGRQAVALRRPGTVGFRLADLLSPRRNEVAGFAAAARPLAGAALRVRPPVAALGRAVHLLVFVTNYSRITAYVMALVIVVSAVTLLSRFHDLVSAEGSGRGREAVPFLVVVYGVEDVRYVSDATDRKFAVVWSVAASCRGKHYEIAV